MNVHTQSLQDTTITSHFIHVTTDDISVLGATGGGFTPQPVREYGAFDHYSLVTVDNEEANIAIIEPGNIHPADISTAAFKDKVSKLLTFKTHFTHTKDDPSSSGSLEISLENTLEKPLKVELAFEPSQNWQVSPHQLSIQAKPGKTTKTSVNITVPSDALVPLPIYKYSVLYGGEQLLSGRKLFHPIDREHIRVLKNWMLLGPFDLGVKKAPADSNDIPPNFLSISLPKLNVVYGSIKGKQEKSLGKNTTQIRNVLS